MSFRHITWLLAGLAARVVGTAGNIVGKGLSAAGSGIAAAAPGIGSFFVGRMALTNCREPLA